MSKDQDSQDPRPDGTANGRSARPRVADVLEGRPPHELEELYRFWSGNGENGHASRDLRAELTRLMSDPANAEARLNVLGRRMCQIFELHLDAAHYTCAFDDLLGHKQLALLSNYDLEAALDVLQRHGLLVATEDRRFKSFGSRAFVVPQEVGDGVLRQRRAKRRGVFDVLTLRGWLDRQYDDPARAKRMPPTRLRELYKLYSGEGACVARIERMDGEFGDLVGKAILQFGGLLPRSLFERMEWKGGTWNAPLWRQKLEESLVGTVERLELSRYGIHHNEEMLVIFNEVALAWLKRVAVPGDPDAPHSEASLGVDLVSNISRFIGFILEHNVRFTVRGEIFKTTEKRILQELIPNPGRELSREDVLGFIYDVTRAFGLIESTGERTFAMSPEGRAWESKPLEEKLEALLEFVVEEKNVGGDFYHQVRLRRILIRLLKRIEPGTWYDLMYLPFLARNTYLASLDQLEVDEYFASRSQSAHYAPMEDTQRLAWNLVRWVRQRLHLLGLVDLGYDSSDRPVAMRLTRSGARLLGVVDGTPDVGPGLGSLIVTPDFEIVLFPTGDDAELVHELDRFCVRERAGETLHFKVLDRTVQRALSEGMQLSRMLNTLRSHSRTPVPQNVIYSIRDWANRAGLMLLDGQGVLSAEDPEALKRFLHDPAARAHVREERDERSVQLKMRFAPRRTQSVLRELGFLVELSE
jgi:hypothetical protein